MKNSLNKQHLVSIIILAVIVLGFVFSKDIVRFWYESQTDPACVAEKQKTESGYILGEIVVTFKGNVTEPQAKQFIESRGLLFGGFDYGYTRIGVPEGSELKWVCVLLNETTIVERVFTNHMTQTL